MFRDVLREELLTFTKPVERPKGGDGQINRAGAELFGGILRSSGDFALLFVLEEGAQVRQLDPPPVRDRLILRPSDESAEERSVSALCMLGLPAFVADVLKKVFDQLLHSPFARSRSAEPA